MGLTLTPEQIAICAQRHEQSRQAAQPFKRNTLEFPEMTLDDAYAVQTAWVQQQTEAGARVIGHKVGLTSRAMQVSMNIDEPDFGTLLDYMDIPDGSTLRAADFIDPRIEVELAFVLGSRLAGPDVTMFDVLDATSYVVPALELIDARSYRVDPDDGSTRGVVDTISDNAANAGIITGGRPVEPGDIDLRWASALLSRNGVIEESGVAAAVMNHPARGVVWLARKFAEQGRSLEPGQIILAGSFTRPVMCRSGDVFHVDYGPLGSISLTFD